jgi:hypothetical protein
MPYDVPLILSLVIFFFAVLGFISAMLERHSLIRHALVMVVAVGMFYYAWSVSDGQLEVQSVPDAFMRIISKIS